MKLSLVVAAAGFATGAIVPVAPVEAQRAVVGPGAPTGPGWYGYHDRTHRRGWDGPHYWGGPGAHRGSYAWNGGYYRHCSYRWGRRHVREWRCW